MLSRGFRAHTIQHGVWVIAVLSRGSRSWTAVLCRVSGNVVNDFVLGSITSTAHARRHMCSALQLSQSEALCSSHADAQRLEDVLCRVSGNVVNDFVLGSIMSAVHVYGVRLVVVLGHTRCGMVARAIQHWARHEHKKAQDSLGASSEQVKPLIFGLLLGASLLLLSRSSVCGLIRA